MNGRGFFAKGTEIIEIRGSHVAYLLEHPENFNMDREWMLEQYREFGEPIGFEGKARAEILIQAMSDGWVRIRESFSKEGGRWTFEFYTWASRRDTVRHFVRWARIGRAIQMFDVIELNGIDDGFRRTTDIGEIESLFEEEG